MLQLIKRHWILTAFCLFCVLLIFIGWSVRPDVETESGKDPEIEPPPQEAATSTVQPLSTTPAPVVSDDECEIPAEWLLSEGDVLAEPVEERFKRVVAFSDTLSSSRNPEDLVFYTVLAEQNGKALSRLVEEIDAGSRSPYLVWKAVNRCLSRNGSAFACPRAKWIELQKQLDGDNSEVWMRLAGLRFAQSDDAAGIAALERAANATRTEDYFARDLQTIVSGAEASGEVSRYEAAVFALGVSASVLPAYEYHSYACLDRGITDAYRIQLCEQYARNVQSRPTSAIVASMARSIETFARKTVGDTEGVEALEAEAREETQAAMQNISLEQDREFLERLNPDLVYEYLADYAAYGEQEAQTRRVRRLNDAGLEAFQVRCSEQLAAYREAIM